jgi:nicotinamide-nucleotide amidase
MLGDVTRRGRVPEVGITASEATISLRITASAASREDAELAIQPTMDEIHEKLGSLIYGTGEETLPTVVANLLHETEMTISTAESCTGGLVGHLLTEIPGISRYYIGGVVAYSNEVKHELLGVPVALLEKYGAVSPEVATAMAQGCRSRFESDLAVAVTGIAGPDGGSAEKPVGLVYIALAHGDETEIGKYNWPAGRSSVKLRSAKTALNLVRLHLQRQLSKLASKTAH